MKNNKLEKQMDLHLEQDRFEHLTNRICFDLEMNIMINGKEITVYTVDGFHYYTDPKKIPANSGDALERHKQQYKNLFDNHLKSIINIRKLNMELEKEDDQ
ncbi:hypothetical protein [Bacillus sp. AFS031507]|uniref:hypothetical protein n=1 Tax=Bacillus sp. AFS031507 TaxID=2033496 RepID=UPI000BFE2703|nr:hypothetical protein [Bacillus sp. AFS031507]PGY13191.1 hypothetical protein COE25_08525 [Bacillus sp. AFS031507]